MDSAAATASTMDSAAAHGRAFAWLLVEIHARIHVRRRNVPLHHRCTAAHQRGKTAYAAKGWSCFPFLSDFQDFYVDAGPILATIEACVATVRGAGELHVRTSLYHQKRSVSLGMCMGPWYEPGPLVWQLKHLQPSKALAIVGHVRACPLAGRLLDCLCRSLHPWSLATILFT